MPTSNVFFNIIDSQKYKKSIKCVKKNIRLWFFSVHCGRGEILVQCSGNSAKNAFSAVSAEISSLAGLFLGRSGRKLNQRKK